jgi:hypothetical protein
VVLEGESDEGLLALSSMVEDKASHGRRGREGAPHFYNKPTFTTTASALLI